MMLVLLPKIRCLTSVSAAAHCVGHGFDIQIFEAGQKEKISQRVNNTSGLQIHSVMYRFHPSSKMKPNTRYDGIIAAVGICGEEVKGERVIIIGGASAVEALEFAAYGEAEKTVTLARSDKWILSSNHVVDVLLALNIFGGKTILAWIPEMLLRKVTGALMVNSDAMYKIRSGQAEWLRGDIKGFTEDGIRFNRRAKGVPAGGSGREELIKTDTVPMATGYECTSLSFLPEDNFQGPYTPPNCTYANTIGSKFAPKAVFDFFTYFELVWWFTFCIVINPFR
ncbi:hypothetical protein BGZ60DRAFT_508004 [Tricladium varicosporioides]|nr:hypothetical protein BGZ60DRAFT_508004 [Hymenoscyphus varicosporioides]